MQHKERSWRSIKNKALVVILENGAKNSNEDKIEKQLNKAQTQRKHNFLQK